MTRITNAEQVLVLLRARLERTRGAERRGKVSSAKAKPGPPPGPIERVQDLTGAGLSDAQLERALISGLLAEEFGPSLANEPKFQQVVDDVAAALRRDDYGRNLLREATFSLKS